MEFVAAFDEPTQLIRWLALTPGRSPQAPVGVPRLVEIPPGARKTKAEFVHESRITPAHVALDEGKPALTSHAKAEPERRVDPVIPKPPKRGQVGNREPLHGRHLMPQTGFMVPAQCSEHLQPAPLTTLQESNDLGIGELRLQR